MSTFETEVGKGQRFEFGRNWRSFLSTLNDAKISIAEDSLRKMLRIDSLSNKKFLDIGSGSGLFSLVARKLGAEVYSFDFDPVSVSCTKELRSRYFPDDAKWVVRQGSVLDESFFGSLGSFDVVYSWGVLHHTGDMWAALNNATSLVKKDGVLFIGIYNDQGRKSKFWRGVKQLYCSGIAGKALIVSIFVPYFFLRTLLASVVKRENQFDTYKKNRGMSVTHDWFDWLGGLPYEVATVEQIFHFCQDRGFLLQNIRTTIYLGINQFVFVKRA